MAASKHANNQIVSFVCQKCSQPLMFEQALQIKEMVTLGNKVTEDLIMPVDTEEKDPGTAEDGVKQSYPYARLDDVPSGDRMTSDNEESEDSKLDAKIERTRKQITVAEEFFDLLSSHCVVDHPLCKECPEAVLDGYDQQIIFSQDAAKKYQTLLERLKDQLESTDAESAKLDEELESLRQAEKELKDKLVDVEKHRNEVQEMIKKEEERKKQLDAEEEQYWQDFNQFQRQMLELHDEQVSVEYQLAYSNDQLHRLRKTNVINHAFHIWHNGLFGTINGFRLGRLTTVPVEWSEINAAWGQATLLLYTLARKVQFTFKRYRLIPYGNQSFIKSTEGKENELPLYGGGGMKFFWDAKFDAAMVAYIDCLQQFKRMIETSNRHFTLPYKIVKENIGDSNETYSVKMRFNSLEQWTKAMKFMLTNLKWALTWVTTTDITSEVKKFQ